MAPIGRIEDVVEAPQRRGRIEDVERSAKNKRGYIEDVVKQHKPVVFGRIEDIEKDLPEQKPPESLFSPKRIQRAKRQAISTTVEGLKRLPIVGFTPEEIYKGAETYGDIFRRPLAGLTSLSVETPFADAKKSVMKTFVSGLTKPEQYPPERMSEALVNAGIDPTSAASLATLGQFGYYLGMGRGLAGIIQKGKIALLNKSVQNIADAIQESRGTGGTSVKLRGDIARIIAKNKDIADIVEIYARSRNVKLFPRGIVKAIPYAGPGEMPPAGMVEFGGKMIPAATLTPAQQMVIGVGMPHPTATHALPQYIPPKGAVYGPEVEMQEVEPELIGLHPAPRPESFPIENLDIPLHPAPRPENVPYESLKPPDVEETRYSETPRVGGLPKKQFEVIPVGPKTQPSLGITPAVKAHKGMAPGFIMYPSKEPAKSAEPIEQIKVTAKPVKAPYVIDATKKDNPYIGKLGLGNTEIPLGNAQGSKVAHAKYYMTTFKYKLQNVLNKVNSVRDVFARSGTLARIIDKIKPTGLKYQLNDLDANVMEIHKHIKADAVGVAKGYEGARNELLVRLSNTLGVPKEAFYNETNFRRLAKDVPLERRAEMNQIALDFMHGIEDISITDPDSAGRYMFMARNSVRGGEGTQGFFSKDGVIKGTRLSPAGGFRVYESTQSEANFLASKNTNLSTEDAFKVIDSSGRGDLILSDSPYAEETGYKVGAFTIADSKRLINSLVAANERGAEFTYHDAYNPELVKEWQRLGYKTYEVTVDSSFGKGGTTKSELFVISTDKLKGEKYGVRREEISAPATRAQAARQVREGRDRPALERARSAKPPNREARKPIARARYYEPEVEKNIDKLVRAKNLTPRQLKKLRQIYNDLDGPAFVDAIAGIVPSSKPGKPPSIPQTASLTLQGFYDQQFKEPTVARFITPHDIYIRYLGLWDALGPSIEAKTKMQLESTKFRHAVDALEREYMKFVKVGFKEKLKSVLTNIPVAAKAELWDYLHVPKDRVDIDVPPEYRPYHDAIRKMTDAAIQRANLIRIRYGEEPIRYLNGYIMHISDALTKVELKEKYPIPHDVAYWLERIHPKKIFNPTAMARTRRTESGLLKDPFIAVRAMMAADLKQIYLTAPNVLFKQKIEALMKAGILPKSTRLYAEAFMNIVIKGYPSNVDKIVDKSLETVRLPQLMNVLMRPFGRAWGTSSVNAIAGGIGRIVHDAVIWGRIKLVVRNHTQKLLGLGLYPSKHFVKSFLPENPELRKFIDESNFFNISRSVFMEQLPQDVLGKLEKIGFTPYGHSHAGRVGGNVPMTMKMAYHAAKELVDNPKYMHLGWTMDDVKKEMDYGANTAQYWYNLMGMPEIYKHKALRPLVTLQSWGMNYAFKYWREMLHRGFAGKTGWGKPIPPSWRWGAIRHMIASVVFIEGMRRAFGLDYRQTALLGVLPAYLSPPGQVVLGLWQLASARTDWQRKKAITTLKYSWHAFLPGSGAWKDVADVWTGKKPLKAIIFHTEKPPKQTRELYFR